MKSAYYIICISVIHEHDPFSTKKEKKEKKTTIVVGPHSLGLMSLGRRHFNKIVNMVRDLFAIAGVGRKRHLNDA